jgi:hypothetical protein
VLKPGQSRPPSEDDDEQSPPGDPNRAVKRLVFAIVLQAVVDYTAVKDRRIWSSAKSFLFGADPQARYHFHMLTEAMDSEWLRDGLEKVRQETAAPPECKATFVLQAGRKLVRLSAQDR